MSTPQFVPPSPDSASWEPAVAALGALMPSRVEFLKTRVVRAVTKLAGDPPDLRVRRIVTELVEIFLESDAHPRTAAKRAEPLMAELGIAEARAGRPVHHLEQIFAASHHVVSGTLNQVFGSLLSGGPMLLLRMQIKEYSNLLLFTASASLQTEHLRISRADSREQIHMNPVGPTGQKAPQRVRAVVAVEEELTERLRRDDRFIAQDSPGEVLVPEGVSVEEIEALAESQVVVGPLTTWRDLPDSMVLVCRAARLLSEGRVRDDRLVVPCADLITELLVAGNPVLTDLLVAKHLAVLETMTERRRNEIATTLLRWLETGSSASQLARELGMAPQTLHNRLARVRETFGEKLDDPTARLELIIALRAVLPHWTSPT